MLTSELKYYIASGVYNVFFHPLAKFPGPATSAISRLPLIQSHFKGKLHQWFDDVHAKYGSIVRIAPNELSTISPQAWKDIYQSRPFLFKDSYSLTPPLNNAHSLFTAPDGVHHRIRRVFANAFSENALREQSSVIETQVDGFIRRVRREIAYTRGEVDMARFYGYLALDIVGELVYGESFHSLDQEEENNLIRIFALGAKFGSLRTSLSRYHPLELVFGWVGLRLTSKQRTANWKRFQKWTTARLRMGSLGTGRSDFISPVIGNLENEKKMSITRPELDTNSGAIAMAGSSLPTIALTAATYFLLCYPQTLEKLMREIRSNFQAGEEITVLSTQNLPYLKAVITETLRIHHPTPSQLPRLVPNGGRTICGHFIPGGVSKIIKESVSSQPNAIYQTDKLHSASSVFHCTQCTPVSKTG